MNDEETKPRPNENILVVVAESQLGHLLERSTLAPAGYQVTMIQDRRMAESVVKASPPDLVIIDSRIDNGNGISLVKSILNKYPAMPVVLIDTQDCANAIDAMRVGVVDVLCPPMHPDQILVSVNRGLQRRDLISAWVEEKAAIDTDELRKRVGLLETLQRVGRSVTASLDLDEVLTAVVDAAVGVTGAEEGSLLLLDQESGDIYMRAARNFKDDFVRTFRLQVEDSLAGKVIRTGKPILLNEDTPMKIKTAYLVKTLIYVPLRAQDKVVGVLGVDNRHQDQLFTEHHLSLVSALADYAAVAIENARLYYFSEIERKKLETILTRIADGVVVVDTDSNILLMNRSARSAFGINGEVVTGRPVREVISNLQLLDLFDRRLEGHTTRGEISIDDERVLNAQLSVIQDIGYVITMQDITHLKQLDRIKNDFVNTVSHDLRSPLTAILGYVELIERAGEVNDKQHEFIQRVQFSVRSITNLMNDLLDLGRIESGFDTRKDLVPVNGLVHYSVDSMEARLKSKDLELVMDIPTETASVYGDSARLRQMMENLLGNAIKFTPDGGKIHLRLMTQDDQVIFEIRDTGIGIPLAEQSYIFDKFFRASNIDLNTPGSGLGLAIVKSIVEHHQGRIWVESMAGEGATFTVVLPVASPGAE